MNVSEVLGQPDTMEFAGNMVERHDIQDQSTALLELTGVAQHGCSGLNDFEYEDLNSLSMRLKAINQIATVNRVPIPNEIMEHFKNIKCHCMMGLFPEIGRAWLTIDSDIYIWTYENTRDVAYFDGLSDLIVSVGLVTPKAGVFIADVKHLLILTTAVEIVVLGVTFGTTSAVASPGRVIADEMQLLNKPIFVINTDNVSINVVQGTADGRIFLGGSDGNLYEVVYQAESSWFGKRCKKINHSQSLVSYVVPGFLKIFSEVDPITKLVVDNSRGLLYVLTEKGTVEAWDLGDSNQMRRLARLSGHEIASAANRVTGTTEQASYKPITALCALDISDSVSLNLLAVTHAGVRFYFSTGLPMVIPTATGPAMPSPEPQRHTGLYLMHVRIPPGNTPSATCGTPKQVHKAFYKNGAFLMVSTSQPDLDELWSVTSEPFPKRTSFVESSTSLQLDGQVFAIGEIKPRRPNTFDSLVKAAQTPRKIVILTNQGAHIVALLKPVDFLRQLLISCHGSHHDAIKAFFQHQTEPYACATSLGLACLEQIRSPEITQWATQAFMLYGGEPHFVIPQQPQQQQMQGQPFMASPFQSQNRSFNNSSTFMEAGAPIFMSTPFPATRPASSVQQSLMQQTQYPVPPNQQSQSLPQEQMNLSYSAKHAGLYLYIARLFRPIWKRRCIDQKMASTINSEDCSEVLSDLHAIKAFLEANSVSHISAGPSRMNGNIMAAHGYGGVPSFNQQQQIMQRKTAEEALSEEKKSLDALHRFIKHTAEVIGLWKILCEHQLNILLAQLPKDLVNVLSTCTFRDLVLTHLDICAQLIVTLINTYLNDSASINSISSKLREICPTLYRHEDAVSHKATEILMLSKSSTDRDEKEERLKTALQLCKGAAPKLPLANICQQFAMAGFYQGVIDLCVTCASKIEPNTSGVDYEAYAARNKCYKVVCDMLESVYQNLRNANTTIDMTRGLPMDEERERNINQKVLQIVGIALQTTDKALHHAVYEWLLAHDLLNELLGIADPSLGEFLGRSAEQAPENLKISDLLWKYHERNGQHDSAAKILYSLASSDTDRIDLQQRIEYLARAIMCMRSDSVGCSAHNGVLLKELEDKLEIARVQKQVLDAIESLPMTNHTRDAAKSLNSTLYDMTHLYSDFCEDFELWECKLTIFNCSHHNDALLIESVWAHILDAEMSYPGSNVEKCRRLLSKVANLASEYGGGGHCFPLQFIIRELEFRSFKFGLTDSPVPEALINMRLDPDNLLDIYASLVSMSERFWITDGDELFIVRSIVKLLKIILEQSGHSLNRNRRRLAKFQDLISVCLNVLYTKPNTEALREQLRGMVQ